MSHQLGQRGSLSSHYVQQLTGILMRAPFYAHCIALSGVILVWQSVELCYPRTPNN